MREYLTQLPSLPYPLRALLLLTAGIVLLRIAGKRSLAEMTVAEAVMRIAIGTVLIQPLGMKKEWDAIYGGTLLIIGIVLWTKLQHWIPKVRSLFIGVPSVVIKDGKMMLEEIKKAKLTTDEVEAALRQNQVGSLADVELGIFETSGKLSTTLKPDKAPATKEDLQKILDILADNGIIDSKKMPVGKTAGLFKEAYDEGEKEGYKPQKP